MNCVAPAQNVLQFCAICAFLRVAGVAREGLREMAVKFFKRGDPLHVQAQRIWLILISHVMSGKSDGPIRTVTYGDVAEAMGYDRKAGVTLSRQLGIVGQFCVDNGLPPLNAIVVMEETGAPGPGVIVSPGKSVGQDQRSVQKFGWFTVRVPTTGTFRTVWENM